MNVRISFLPKLNDFTGHVYASLMVAHLEEMFKLEDRVSLFLVPCPCNRQYEEGMSWTEILNCSRFEAMNALAKICHKHRTKGFFNASDDVFSGMPYCSYVDQFSGVTHYLRNAHHEIFGVFGEYATSKETESVEQTTNQVSLSVESGFCPTNQESESVGENHTLLDYSLPTILDSRYIENKFSKKTYIKIEEKNQKSSLSENNLVIGNPIYPSVSPTEKAVSNQKKAVKFISWEYGYKGISLSMILLADKPFINAFDEWTNGLDSRRKKRSLRTEQALKLEIKKIEEFYHQDKQATISYIQWGTTSHWQSLNHRGADSCFMQEIKRLSQNQNPTSSSSSTSKPKAFGNKYEAF
jgi:hypothetical protein